MTDATAAIGPDAPAEEPVTDPAQPSLDIHEDHQPFSMEELYMLADQREHVKDTDLITTLTDREVGIVNFFRLGQIMTAIDDVNALIEQVKPLADQLGSGTLNLPGPMGRILGSLIK